MALRKLILFALYAVQMCSGQTSESQSEVFTGLFTVEQPGTGECFTFDPADHARDVDRVKSTRCRETLPRDGTLQAFTVHALDDGTFSLATPDGKCFYADAQNELQRSAGKCDKRRSYFLTERITGTAARAGSDILIKQWPSNLCVTTNLDGTVNLVVCDPASDRQKWRVCRSDDAEVCLRYYER